MAQNKQLNFLFIISCMLFVSCDDGFDCFKSTGKTVTEQRVLQAFNKIDLSDNVDLKIEYGSLNAYSVTAGKNLIDNITTEVKNGTLTIRNKNECNWVRSFKNKFVVKLTLDTLVGIDFSGVGDIDFVNTFLADSFRIEVFDGWGDIDLKYKGKSLRLVHHIGGVNFRVTGEADDFYLYLADNAQADCSEISTRINQVWSISTGNCRINVTEKLNARLSYIGNVYYKGNPSLIESTIESTGKLILEL